jgi:hypothetical protein
MPTQEAHFSLSDGPGHHRGHQGGPSYWGGSGPGHQRGCQGFLLIGVGLALGNPTPMRRRADGTNTLVEERISGLCALQAARR